jgi:hypothetical protein
MKLLLFSDTYPLAKNLPYPDIPTIYKAILISYSHGKQSTTFIDSKKGRAVADPALVCG